jgi:hypothetical protein
MVRLAGILREEVGGQMPEMRDSKSSSRLISLAFYLTSAL